VKDYRCVCSPFWATHEFDEGRSRHRRFQPQRAAAAETHPAAARVCAPASLPDGSTVLYSVMIAYGFTAGLGVEMALLQNVFVRAEWEFIQFPNIADFRVSANSARLGVGLKF
jgi:hypothetical protein